MIFSIQNNYESQWITHSFFQTRQSQISETFRERNRSFERTDKNERRKDSEFDQEDDERGKTDGNEIMR